MMLPVLGIVAWLVVRKVGLGFLALVLAAVLLGNVIAAVHHAEIVALRVGEPYGTLVLALAVTTSGAQTPKAGQTVILIDPLHVLVGGLLRRRQFAAVRAGPATWLSSPCALADVLRGGF